MAYQIPTIEPLRFVSGDTVQWKRSFGDYPAGTWTLTYTLVGPLNKTFTATASGTTHHVNISSTNSFDIIPGNYRLHGYVSSGSERYQVYAGQLTVEQDPATVASGAETRTFYRQLRDHLQDILVGKSQQSISTYTIGERTVSKMSWQELIDAYNWAAARASAEDAAERSARGEQNGMRIGWRFR